ncbi:MAG: hypothetical protein RLZ10_1732 [Bacteroidota bacterium]|jgi:hypothetical protein
MNFKFFNNEENRFLTLEPTQILTLTRPAMFNPSNVEFCFQFGDEEPVVFGSGPNECQIRLSPQSDANMIFNDNGRVFKLFARERQDG